MVFQRHLERDTKLSVKQIKQEETIKKKIIVIMAEYINSTLNSNDWELYFTLSTYRECLVILIILFYGLKYNYRSLVIKDI